MHFCKSINQPLHLSNSIPNQLFFPSKQNKHCDMLQKLIFLILLTASSSANLIAQSTLVTQPSPAFPFDVLLTSPDSNTNVSSTTLLDQKHKATLLAFWLTTCFPCSTELETYAHHYKEWQEKYDLKIIAISLDFPDRFPQIKQRLQQKNYPFEVWWDSARAFKSILPGGLNGFPQVFLFNQKGNLVWQHKGFRPGDEQKLLQAVSNL
jgi:thiol-disulfide isomerase/thioredoxin